MPESYGIRWVALVLPITVLACSMSRADYCASRQQAWERAFPDQPQTADQRRLFVDSCTRYQETDERWRCRINCLREHIRAVAPRREYQAMTECEQVCFGGKAGPQPATPPRP